MEYPLISEYKEAILAAEDNFNELSSLRPVLDDYGNPVMSSGNFAVVFKMKDEIDGKFYAVKCFIKDQEGRDESYRKIADELEMVSSSYLLPLRYLENELFVDTDHCQEDEFPVVVMEWVEGETLDTYMNRNLHDIYELEMLSYRFNRMAVWLLTQPFAHGDLKPDNILVRKDGSLVLVDYDGMFVPSMKGEKARELGSPDYRHPSRSADDFDEHIDDFSIAVIALSFKAIAINPSLKLSLNSSDTLLMGERDFQDSANSKILKDILSSSSDVELSRILSPFFLVLANNSLDMMSFRLFMTEKPERDKNKSMLLTDDMAYIDTSVSEEDIAIGVKDEFGVMYSKDGKRLLGIFSDLVEYHIKPGTVVICDEAFLGCESLKFVTIPNSVIRIGHGAFYQCESIQSISIPESVKTIGNSAFSLCTSLKRISISKSVKSIGYCAFHDCSSLNSITLPDSVSVIEKNTFTGCISLINITIPNSITVIKYAAFAGCTSLRSVVIPESVTNIEEYAFRKCTSLQNISIPKSLTIIKFKTFSDCSALMRVTLPNSITAIHPCAFFECSALQNIMLPDSLTMIGEYAFFLCESLKYVEIPKSLVNIGKDAFPENCQIIRRKSKS